MEFMLTAITRSSGYLEAMARPGSAEIGSAVWAVAVPPALHVTPSSRILGQNFGRSGVEDTAVITA